jgi:hypothetical protein
MSVSSSMSDVLICRDELLHARVTRRLAGGGVVHVVLGQGAHLTSTIRPV